MMTPRSTARSAFFTWAARPTQKRMRARRVLSWAASPVLYSALFVRSEQITFDRRLTEVLVNLVAKIEGDSVRLRHRLLTREFAHGAAVRVCV